MCVLGGSKGRREEGTHTVQTQVSLDLEGATEGLFTFRHPRHLVFCHAAGPLPLSISASVRPLFLQPFQLERNPPGGNQTLFIDASACW